MRNFSIFTLGCKVNQYESEQICEFLRQLGLKNTDSVKSAQLVVVNTCCVTHSASSKCRQYINKVHRQNPSAKIVITGCLARARNQELPIDKKNTYIIKYRQNYTKALKQIIKGTYKKNPTKKDNIEHNLDSRTSKRQKIKDKPPNLTLCSTKKLPSLTKFSGHTRAFLKVQDGCDGWCSYCIIPQVRSEICSRKIPQILSEAEKLVESGHKEIVVTGVFLGAYGKNTVKAEKWESPINTELMDLLETLCSVKGLERIRLSSLCPSDINKPLVRLIKNQPKIMPHLHLSLQSGSDKILKRMARRYNSRAFLEKIALLRTQLDRPAITTDIIVGFPGENEQDFYKSCRVAEKAGFSKIHIFPFSPRSGTAAAKMKNRVQSKIIKNRAKELKNISEKLSADYRKQFTGENCNVLIEKSGKTPQGLSERYFPVLITKTHRKIKRNEIVKVKLLKSEKNHLTAEY
jgi:threonylcarbamoyladenosine tRNA methylthiotransferase MtaB